VLPPPGNKEGLHFLSKDSLRNASNYPEIITSLLTKEYLSKLDQLRKFILNSRDRLKGFVSLSSFHEFLVEALRFLKSDQQDAKLNLLLNRNYKAFEKGLLEQFRSEVVMHIQKNRNLQMSLVKFAGKDNWYNLYSRQGGCFI
jgi:hypothetical protein